MNISILQKNFSSESIFFVDTRSESDALRRALQKRRVKSHRSSEPCKRFSGFGAALGRSGRIRSELISDELIIDPPVRDSYTNECRFNLKRKKSG